MSEIRFKTDCTGMTPYAMRTYNADWSKELGIVGAAIVQQIHFWLQKNIHRERNIHEGRPWMYSTLQEMIDRDFPSLSKRTLQNQLNKLKDKGILLTGNFNRMPQDRTTWYSLDYDALEDLNARLAS